MILVKRLVLDVLKPHTPNSLEFAKALAEQQVDCHITIAVIEVDVKTESVVITVQGEAIQFDKLTDTIVSLGGSLHSIDEVEVANVVSAD